MQPAQTPLMLALAVSTLPFAACGIDVQNAARGKNIDIKSPVGAVSVRTDVDSPKTGLPVYPGASPLRDDDDPESATVNVSSAWFGVKVVAANYQSADGQDKILDYYRREMKTYGPVTECRGDVDFRGGPGNTRPVCREQPHSRDVQLLTGRENNQRIVAVKPRGSGTAFSLVHVNTRG